MPTNAGRQALQQQKFAGGPRNPATGRRQEILRYEYHFACRELRGFSTSCVGGNHVIHYPPSIAESTLRAAYFLRLR